VKDPITSEERKPDERFMRSVEEKYASPSRASSPFPPGGREKGMGAYKRGESSPSTATRRCTTRSSSTSSSSAAMSCAW